MQRELRCPAYVRYVDDMLLFANDRRLKGRKVVHFRRRLRERLAGYQAGERTAAEVGISIRGWLNHARYGDTWGLRRAVLRKAVL